MLTGSIMKLLWNRWKQMNFKVKISTQRGDPGCTRLAVPAEPQLMDSSVPSESLRVALGHWYVLGPWCYTVRTGVAVELESHPLHKDMGCWLQGFCVFSCKYLPHKWSGLHRHLFFFFWSRGCGALEHTVSSSLHWNHSLVCLLGKRGEIPVFRDMLFYILSV